MNKEEMFKVVKELPFDSKKSVFKDKNGVEVLLFRPSELSSRFKDYDKTKNFQIWLKDGDREFRPNHLRILIDLNLRIRSRSELKEKLLIAFDNIFYGKDPEEELKQLEKEKFAHYLNNLTLMGVLAQLFIIEQEHGYHKESNFDPPSLFLQGWIREFIDSPKEIDNMCMSVCSGQPPKADYVNKENKKGNKFVKDLKPLWYLQDN
ncbi:MAG TPA: hypothetical protein HA362_03115 [Nanoarchaeota archaeon]|nr:hypothetical protein [Nanoarchaeota archaeon]